MMHQIEKSSSPLFLLANFTLGYVKKIFILMTLHLSEDGTNEVHVYLTYVCTVVCPQSIDAILKTSYDVRTEV